MNSRAIQLKSIKLKPLIELFDLESAKLSATSKNFNLDKSKIYEPATTEKGLHQFLIMQQPKVAVGDTVQIDVLIQEIIKSEEKASGKAASSRNTATNSKQNKKIIKERIQSYSGVVIAIKNKGINKNITVRRIFQGIGVERVFNLVSPSVNKIHILKKASVRRAKLYYLRGKQGKAAKLKEKI